MSDKIDHRHKNSPQKGDLQSSAHSRSADWLQSNIAVSPSVLRQAKPTDEKSGPAKTSDPKPQENKESAENTADNSEKGKAKNSKKTSPAKKWIILGIVLLVVIVSLIIGVPWYLHARLFETTDDAFIDTHYEKVSPQVAARVLRVPALDNLDVNPGDILVELDPADFQAAVEQARATQVEAQARVGQQQAQEKVALANLTQSRADLNKAKADRDNAYAQLKRYEGLSEESRVPQQLDNLRTQASAGDANVESAEGKVVAMAAQVALAAAQIQAAVASAASAQAQLVQANLRLSYTKIRAVVGGRVTNRNVQAGDYVAIAQQLLVLVPREVWVTANFKETQLTDMRPGQEVDIEVDAYPDLKFKGRIDSIQKGSGAWFALLPPENATGNYVKVVQRVPVKIVFDDKEGKDYQKLGPGMSVVPKAKVR